MNLSATEARAHQRASCAVDLGISRAPYLARARCASTCAFHRLRRHQLKPDGCLLPTAQATRRRPTRIGVLRAVWMLASHTSASASVTSFSAALSATAPGGLWPPRHQPAGEGRGHGPRGHCSNHGFAVDAPWSPRSPESGRYGRVGSPSASAAWRRRGPARPGHSRLLRPATPRRQPARTTASASSIAPT